jgi:hypothetical protein
LLAGINYDGIYGYMTVEVGVTSNIFNYFIIEILLKAQKEN